MSICIVIGAASYEDRSVNDLPGAEVDAKAFFSVATDNETGICDVKRSKLLCDPTKEEVRLALANALNSPNVKNLTLYFAGHGIETNSGYFLTCRDTLLNRLALTGLSLTDIFQILNERSGLHTNIVIDACQAGGMAIDLPAITKSYDMGTAGGSSVSILAMSSRYEPAKEALDGSGGVGTTALLDVMRGNVDTAKNVAELTLADVAQILMIKESPQTPSFWSFNLQGQASFCKNTYALKFRNSEVYETPEIFGEIQTELSWQHKEQIWQCNLDFPKSLDARDVFEVVSETVTDPAYFDTAPALLNGLFESFLLRARESEDSFAPVIIASVFSMIASDKLDNSNLASYFVRVLSDELRSALSQLADDLEKDHFFLVRGVGDYSAFVTLPQRISNIAAWTMVATRIPVLAGPDIEGALEISRRILSRLSKDYVGSFNLISEQQAPSISIISALGKNFSEEWVEHFIGCLYNSYFANTGKIARVDLPADKMFQFLKHQFSDEKPDFQEFCDRPSEALFVIFAMYWHLGLLSTVRYDLSDLDGTTLGTFIPASYSRFSDTVIREGTNLHFKIGFDVFTVSELSDFLKNEVLPRVTEASANLTEVQQAIATIASLVFPNRIPWHLFNLKPMPTQA